MIDRYSTKEMQHLWSLDHKFEIWKNLEVFACEYWNKAGKIPDEDLKNIQEKAKFTTERVLEIEAEVHHDVIAFLTSMAEHIGPSSRFVHFGLTSSDVGDTALSVITTDAANLLLKSYKSFLISLYKQAVKYKDTIAVGRTHGIHAEPTTIGLKFLGYYEECRRNYDRLKEAKEQMSYGKISGAVGTYSQLPPELESYVLDKLGLKVEPVSTQVIPRDRHAVFLNAISIAAQGLSRLAQEIRLLQKTESREVEEPFQSGQKGSSAMPHKRNPILCERICGMARVILGHSVTAQQNIGLWHERDISHSSAERMILPDSTSLLEYMLIKMKFVVENINVYPEACEAVLQKTKGLIFSSRALLVITEKLEMTREDAYKIIQTEAMGVWNDPDSLDLKSRLLEHDQLKSVSEKEWEDVFDPKSFVVNIDQIFNRIANPED